jgi:hypothetical protein
MRAGETTMRAAVRSIAVSTDGQTASGGNRASVLKTLVRSTNKAAGLPSAVSRTVALVLVVGGFAAETVVCRVGIDSGI